jgi:hypothetical protein
MTALPRPLLAALGLTLFVTLYLWLQADDVSTVAPSARTRQRSMNVRGAPDLPRPEAQAPVWPDALPVRDVQSWQPVDSAVAQAWGVPPPAVQAAVPAMLPTTPEPPALDYALIGRIDEAGQQRALLMSPRRTLSLKVGDVVEGQWRVVGLADDSVDLVWQPTGQHRLIAYKTN